MGTLSDISEGAGSILQPVAHFVRQLGDDSVFVVVFLVDFEKCETNRMTTG